MSDYGLFMRTYHVHVRSGAYIPRFNDTHDVAAEIRSPEDLTIMPGEKVQVMTGLHFKMPSAEFVQMLVPAKQMMDREVMLFDSNRLIDTWDSSELVVTLWNTSSEHECVINAGDVIAKITVILNSRASYVTAPWDYVVKTEVEELGQNVGEKDSWNFK